MPLLALLFGLQALDVFGYDILVLFDLQHVNTALKEHDARTVDGIIGADVLKKSKAVIDYSKKRLYLKI